jgi:hypothetical protein
VNVASGCLAKQKYVSKAEAKRVARLMTARHGDAFHLYDCPNCGYFHVGHLVPSFGRTGDDNDGALARRAHHRRQVAYGLRRLRRWRYRSPDRFDATWAL